MKTTKELMKDLENKTMKVESINKEEMTYHCNNGNDYPLLDGMDNLTIEELQEHINNASKWTAEIIKEIERDNG